MQKYIVLLLLCVCAEAKAAPKRPNARELLANVHTVAIVSPFFGVNLPDKPQKNAKARAEEAHERVWLKALLAHAQQRLPIRMLHRTPWKLAGQKETLLAMQKLHLTPQELFQNNGLIQHGKYPLPKPAAVQQLLAALHADALILADLDAPQNISGHYTFSLLGGTGYEPAHEVMKGEFLVALPNGDTALRFINTVEHPPTSIGGRKFVQLDWEEAENLLIENFLDDVTRYLPE